MRLALLAGLAAAGAGCESGWDIRGAVNTRAVSDKAHPIGVFMLNAPSIDLAHLPTEPSRYESLGGAVRVPDEQQAFSHSDFGCHRGQVVVLAWVPKSTPAPAPAGAAVPGTPAAFPFAPKPGDLVAVSDVRAPYCGFRTQYEEFALTLDDTKIQP